MDIATLRAALMDDLARHLAPVPLVDLEVTPDLDHDGDPILRLRAVYDDREGGQVTGRQYLDAIGLVQDRLRASGEPRFGHLTFVAQSDAHEDAA